MKSRLTPGQVLLILLVVPVATFFLLEWIHPDKLTVFLCMAAVPLLMLAARTLRAIIRLF